jgi:putative ABC transport system substrate-binding protein
VIVAVSTPAAVAAKNATSTIPIVFVGPADPVASGLVPNLARPGGNVTGFSPMQAEIGAKWIEILRAFAPKLKRAAYLTDTGNPGEMRVFEMLRERAAAMGATVTVYDAVQPGALDRAFGAIVRDRNEGLAVALTAAMLPHRDRIVAFAADRKLPAVYARREYADAGGIVSYGADSTPLYAKTAEYVHRIATGTRPGDLPVERPMAVRTVVNRRAARAQGIALPPSILALADETIGD